jgi:hypothetical protein
MKLSLDRAERGITYVMGAVVILAVLLFSYVGQDEYRLNPENIHYTKDERTGLCYAYVGSRMALQSSVGLAQVSCSALPDKD